MDDSGLMWIMGTAWGFASADQSEVKLLDREHVGQQLGDFWGVKMPGVCQRSKSYYANLM